MMSRLKQNWLRAPAWAALSALAVAAFSPPAFGQAPNADEKAAAKQPAEKSKPSEADLKAQLDKKRNAAKLRAQRAARKTDQVGPVKPAPQKPGQDVPEPTVVLKPGEVPAIKFDITTYDFGRIRAGGDVIHDFWFTNTGTGPLEILRVKPG
jgi:hypothetical protein